MITERISHLSFAQVFHNPKIILLDVHCIMNDANKMIDSHESLDGLIFDSRCNKIKNLKQ